MGGRKMRRARAHAVGDGVGAGGAALARLVVALGLTVAVWGLAVKPPGQQWR